MNYVLHVRLQPLNLTGNGDNDGLKTSPEETFSFDLALSNCGHVVILVIVNCLCIKGNGVATKSIDTLLCGKGVISTITFPRTCWL